jgi:hypothetical protein
MDMQSIILAGPRRGERAGTLRALQSRPAAPVNRHARRAGHALAFSVALLAALAVAPAHAAQKRPVAASMEDDFRRGDFAGGLLAGIEELEERLPEGDGRLRGPPPRHQVLDDGTFIIGGDVVGDCRTLLEDAEASGTAASREVARQAEACTEASFPPSGAPLPGTGGPSLALVGSAALLGAWVLAPLCRRGLRRR